MCQETIASLVVTVEVSTERACNGVNSYNCDCDLGFQEKDIDGEKVCGNIDDCGGAPSVGSRDQDAGRCGGQTISREFYVWCESHTSDLASVVQTEQKDQSDVEAQLAEFGATSDAFRMKIDDVARSGATSDADLKATSAIRKKERRCVYAREHTDRNKNGNLRWLRPDGKA